MESENEKRKDGIYNTWCFSRSSCFQFAKEKNEDRYNGSYFYFSFFVWGLGKRKRMLSYSFVIFYHEMENRKTKGRYIQGPWCGCECKRWVWEVQWGVNLKPRSSGIWVIKMRIYHKSFIFVMGNSYSCAHGTSLNIRLWWDWLTFMMVKHPLHVKMLLGFSAAMMFLFLVVSKHLTLNVIQTVVWNYVEKI